MGNQQTIGECTAVLQNEVYSLGKDVGVIPDYRIHPSFESYLSPNSSTYLDSHYKEVRRALSPDQLGAFDRSLRATFGQNSTVKQGGVGVVALALSLLFNVLAQQTKNQTQKTHFIYQIFGEHQDVSSSGLEVGTVVIDYLNLVPLIANDPQRMKEETERYEKKLHHSLVGHFESTAMAQNSNWAEWKIFFHGLALHQHMMIHQVRLGADIPVEQLMERHWEQSTEKLSKFGRGEQFLREMTNVVARLESVRPEKHELLAKCKDIDTVLMDHFMYDLSIEGIRFFWSYREHMSDFLRQNDDFSIISAS